MHSVRYVSIDFASLSYCRTVVNALRKYHESAADAINCLEAPSTEDDEMNSELVERCAAAAEYHYGGDEGHAVSSSIRNVADERDKEVRFSGVLSFR